MVVRQLRLLQSTIWHKDTEQDGKYIVIPAKINKTASGVFHLLRKTFPRSVVTHRMFWVSAEMVSKTGNDT